MPPPRRLSRLALAASVALHLVLFLTLSVDGRLPRVPRAVVPRVTIIDLPPVGPDERPASARAPRRAAGSPARNGAVAAIEEPAPLEAPRPDSAAPAPSQTPAFGRIGPGLARGRLWVRPLPLPPRELARRLTRSHEELVDSAVTAVIQSFLDSVAMDPASKHAALPSWTTTIAGTKFGLDSKFLYIAGLRIPAAVLALLPLPSAGNESRAFDRSGQMYDDLRRAAQRAATLDEFKQAIREIRERKDSEREFERNQRIPPPPAETPDQ